MWWLFGIGCFIGCAVGVTLATIIAVVNSGDVGQ